MSPVLSLQPARKSRYGNFLMRLYSNVTRLTWRTIILITLLHVALSGALLLSVDEAGLTHSINDFLYWYAVTASTVGYGDMSPVTVGGKYVTILFVMPGGIALFTSVIAKVVSNLADQWRKRMNGRADYSDMQGHIVLVGWQGSITEETISQIRGDAADARDIVLFAQNETNPLPDMVRYVRGKSLNDSDALKRTGMEKADVVIVRGENDSTTLGATLTVSGICGAAPPHLVSFFASSESAELLSNHCPNVEAVVSISVEATVQSAQDPGSYELVHDLLSNLEGQGQFRIAIPEDAPTFTCERLLAYMKVTHDATLIAIRSRETGKLQLNPSADQMVKAGDFLHVIAERRISGCDVNWGQLSA